MKKEKTMLVRTNLFFTTFGFRMSWIIETLEIICGVILLPDEQFLIFPTSILINEPQQCDHYNKISQIVAKSSLLLD